MPQNGTSNVARVTGVGRGEEWEEVGGEGGEVDSYTAALGKSGVLDLKSASSS